MALFTNNKKEMGDNLNSEGKIIIDVLDDDQFFYIYAEFPGQEKKDIKVKFQGEQLLLKINDSESDYDNDKSYLISERYHFERERLISFSDSIVKKDVVANFNNGLLEVIIKKLDPFDEEEGDLIPIN